jgi:hypothetical protein
VDSFIGVELEELGVGEVQELIHKAKNIAESVDFIKPAKDSYLFRQCKNLRLPLCHSPFTDKNHESGNQR